MFKLQRTNSAEKLQYIILMLISRFWEVLVNFHLFRLKRRLNYWLTWKVIDKETWRLHITQTIFSTSLVSLFFYFLRWKKMFCKKVVLCGTTHPLILSSSVWSLLLSLGPKNHYNLTFVWTCYCLFAGQGLSSSEDDDIARKQKPKENQKRKKKGKNIIDSGNVLGCTPTVSKGTDVETLHKLLYICISFNGFNVHVS